MNELIVLGFDGFAKAVIDSARGMNKYDSIVILDKKDNLEKEFADSKVVGTLDELHDYYGKGYRFVYIANENDMEWRKEVAKKTKDIGFSFATIIDVSADISPEATIGDGTYVGKGCVVGPCVSIGENVILDTGSIIQSGSSIGDLSRVCTRGITEYDVKIGDMCYIGVTSVVVKNTEVPDNTTVADVSVYGKQFFEE